MLYYRRTGENELVGFTYENEKYYYRKNYQNDITGIYNGNYELICEYEYDSYGDLISLKDSYGNQIVDTSHIGHINPYRYRSYYYDRETNLYYLNSRYYNPKGGRFINADGIIGTSETYLGYNLYAYCENCPIIYSDRNGYIAIVDDLVLAAGATIYVLLVYGALTYGPRALEPIVNGAVNVIQNAKNRTKDRTDTKEKEKVTTDVIEDYINIQKPCAIADFSDNKCHIEVGERLSIDEAYYHVSLGGNVMCDNIIYAHQVAIRFPRNFGPEINSEDNQKPGCDYYWHFHPKRESHYHIWFYRLEPVIK